MKNLISNIVITILLFSGCNNNGIKNGNDCNTAKYESKHSLFMDYSSYMTMEQVDSINHKYLVKGIMNYINQEDKSKYAYATLFEIEFNSQKFFINFNFDSCNRLYEIRLNSCFPYNSVAYKSIINGLMSKYKVQNIGNRELFFGEHKVIHIYGSEGIGNELKKLSTGYFEIIFTHYLEYNKKIIDEDIDYRKSELLRKEDSIEAMKSL